MLVVVPRSSEIYLLSSGRVLQTLVLHTYPCELRFSLGGCMSATNPNASPGPSMLVSCCGGVLSVRTVCMFAMAWDGLRLVACWLGANLCGLTTGAGLGADEERIEGLVWGARRAAGVPGAYSRSAVPRATLGLLLESNTESYFRSFMRRATR